MTHRFLIATMPIPGHVAPFVPVARELLRRGHEVVWYGSRVFQRSIEASGARFEPIVSAVDFGDSEYDRHFPERARLSGLKQLIFDFEHLFIGSIKGMIQDLRSILQRYPADVLLGDPAVAATRILSETDGIPSATLNVTVVSFQSRDLAAFGLGLRFNNSPLGRLRNALSYLAVDHVLFRSVNRVYRTLARREGWPVLPFRPSVSKYLQLQSLVPSFDYPISDLPPQVHFLGALLPDAPRDFVPPPWWDDVLQRRRPVVLATQGTIATNVAELIRPTLEALANEDVLVIATSGGKPPHELGFAIPANARVVPFIPFVSVMPHVDLYITNGGYGGVTVALANGVPIISAGVTEDKPEVGNRIEHSGVGINLRTHRPSADRVRAAFRSIMGDPRYRQRAQAMRVELEQHDAPSEAAGLLERLAQTRRPVHGANR